MTYSATIIAGGMPLRESHPATVIIRGDACFTENKTDSDTYGHGEIAGVVQDENSNAVSGCVVMVVSRDGRKVFEKIITKQDGTFYTNTIPSMPDGVCVISVPPAGITGCNALIFDKVIPQ